jgi:hypothetical protein
VTAREILASLADLIERYSGPGGAQIVVLTPGYFPDEDEGEIQVEPGVAREVVACLRRASATPGLWAAWIAAKITSAPRRFTVALTPQGDMVLVEVADGTRRKTGSASPTSATRLAASLIEDLIDAEQD